MIIVAENSLETLQPPARLHGAVTQKIAIYNSQINYQMKENKNIPPD
jgi:hypothetical protein